MTRRATPTAEIPPRLHQVATNARELALDLQRQSWTGGPSSGIEIANLIRAAEHLTDAAQATGWKEPPRTGDLARSTASIGLCALVVAGALTQVPDPGQPAAIVAALITGWIAADIFGRIAIAMQWRRLAAERTQLQDEKKPVVERIRLIQTAVDDIMVMCMTDPKHLHTSHEDSTTAEEVCTAQLWLDRAAEGARAATSR